MKKTLLILLPIVAIIAVAIVFILTRHTHTFVDATCTTAKICECGESEGEPLGHTWTDATCTTAKTCSVCNLTEGTPLEHQWLEATTENPKTCELCGTTEGDPLPAKQGKVEGYSAEEEKELLTGAEIDIDNIESDEEDPLKDLDLEKPTGVSKYAGTTSKHGYQYPADYVPNSGNKRADLERRFDDGKISEESYQDLLDFINDLASGKVENDIQESKDKLNGNSGGGTVPGNGGVTVTVDKGNSYSPDGRICY